MRGIDFGWFGTGFFTLLLLMLFMRRRYPAGGWLLKFGVYATAGAEVRLIWIQKYEIGTWCPVCLCIAGVVAVAVLVQNYELFNMRNANGEGMKTKISNIFVILLVMLIGFGGALLGVQKEAGAAELDIYFGKRKSNTTVYVVSDWFCPVCRKMEPEIEKLLPELFTSARVAFVDMPIHPESTNITPFHLQFILHEKEKYIALRHALDELSRTNKSPTQEQVQSAVTPLGVTLKSLNFMEILNGARQFESIYKGFKVAATPTVVVDNPKTKKRKLLVGSNEITRSLIQAAIAEVEK